MSTGGTVQHCGVATWVGERKETRAMAFDPPTFGFFWLNGSPPACYRRPPGSAQARPSLNRELDCQPVFGHPWLLLWAVAWEAHQTCHHFWSCLPSLALSSLAQSDNFRRLSHGLDWIIRRLGFTPPRSQHSTPPMGARPALQLNPTRS